MSETHPRAIFTVNISHINDGMAKGMMHAIHDGHHAHEIDVVIRKDGVERRFQADWIKHLALLCIDSSADASKSDEATITAFREKIRCTACEYAENARRELKDKK